MSSPVDRVRERLAHTPTSEIVRTVIWMCGGTMGPPGSHPTPLSETIRRACRVDELPNEDVTKVFYAMCHELDMRVPVK